MDCSGSLQGVYITYIITYSKQGSWRVAGEKDNKLSAREQPSWRSRLLSVGGGLEGRTSASPGFAQAQAILVCEGTCPVLEGLPVTQGSYLQQKQVWLIEAGESFIKRPVGIYSR